MIAYYTAVRTKYKYIINCLNNKKTLQNMYTTHAYQNTDYVLFMDNRFILNYLIASVGGKDFIFYF